MEAMGWARSSALVASPTAGDSWGMYRCQYLAYSRQPISRDKSVVVRRASLVNRRLTIILIGLAVPVHDRRLVDGGGPSCGPIWRALSEPDDYGPIASDWCRQAAHARIEQTFLAILAAWIIGRAAYWIFSLRDRAALSRELTVAIENGPERAVVLMSYWAPIVGLSVLLPLILWLVFRHSGVRDHVGRAFDIQVLQLVVGSLVIFIAFIFSGVKDRTELLISCAGLVLILDLGVNAALAIGAISGKFWASSWRPVLLRDRLSGSQLLTLSSDVEG